MSFPVDIPNPNQDNVYYSSAALKTVLLDFFEKDRVSAILEIMENYYIPTFVFDTQGAPDVYNLDVYPTNGQKESFQLDISGTIIDTLKVATPSISEPNENELVDGGFNVSLDPDFHSDTKLKKPNDNEYPYAGVAEGLDLVLATKWQKDPSIKEKMQNFIILKNLLVGQLKTLPEEEMESLKKLYSDTIAQIENFQSILTSIEDGQSTSVDSIKYGKIFEDVYEKDTGAEKPEGFEGLEGTKTLVAQALSDLGNIWDGKKFRPGGVGDKLGEFDHGLEYSMSSTGTGGKLIWINFIRGLNDMGVLDEYIRELPTPREGNTNDENLEDLQKVLKYDGIDVFDVNGKPREWYYNNFQKTLLDQETNWDTLKGYIDQVKITIGKYEKKAKLESLSGGYLLVDQAIKKAILKLCMSNLDVTEYGPRTNKGDNYFSVIGRPGSLGPSGVTPFPSKYSIDDEAYQVKPYTNTSFLCYYALIAIIRGVSGYKSQKFLIDNIKDPDSDHDDVVDLLIDIHGATLDSTSLNEPPIDADAVNGIKSRSIKELLHLYKQMEEFPISDYIYLIPEEDGIPASERSFVQWYIKRIRHTTERALKKNNLSTEGYRLLGDDHPSSVKGGNNEGDLDLDDVPEVYAKMGYLSPFPDEAVANKRLLHVNYGIPKRSAHNNPDVMEFFKQRRYSMPYFWASMTSLWRALTAETLKNLVDSVNEILGTELNLTSEVLLDAFDHGPLWNRIRKIALDLEEENGIAHYIFASADGTLNFAEKIPESFNSANSIRYRNTPGMNTKIMLQGYTKFVSMISNHSAVQIIEDRKPIEFDVGTYLPPEALAVQLNANYANNHGGSAQYITPVFFPYFDKLEFSLLEFQNRLAIKKSKSPIGTDLVTINERYNNFLSDNQRFHQHIKMFEYIISALENIESFVNSFSVPESVSDIFLSGDISLTEDLQDPATLKDQIDLNRRKYEADGFGLGKRYFWKDFDLSKVETLADKQGQGWLYVHVLGLESHLFDTTDSTILVTPEFITASEIIEIPSATHKFNFNYNRKNRIDNRSHNILRYLHLSTGLDISELTFSKHLDPIYSDLLINSESEVFPWAKGDFEDGKPTKPIETLYNMSPLLFPKNLFNDVCIPNKYQRVVACVITRDDLLSTGISVEEIDDAIDDIIGSIRWKVVV